MSPERDPDLDDRWITAMRRSGADVPADAAAWDAVRARAEEGATPVPPPSRAPRLLAAAVVLVLVGVVGGALLVARDDGDGERVRAENPPTTDAVGPDRFFVVTTVLEGQDHGPELCLGGIATSMPPQCGGVPLVGWDWDAVEGEQSQGEVTWGEFEVVGTYDGDAFTLTEDPKSVDPSDDPTLEEDFTTVGTAIGTPCPEPAGGWPPGDPAVWDLDAFTRFMGEIRNVPGFAGLWFDSLGIVPDDPLRGVHTVALTEEGDEAAVRALWGGPLCIVPAEHSMADLRVAAEALAGDAEDLGIDLLGHFVDEVDNVIELQVVWAGDELRAQLDERYGDGLVRVTSALRRIVADEPPAPAGDPSPTTGAGASGFEGGGSGSGGEHGSVAALEAFLDQLRALQERGYPRPSAFLPATLPEGWIATSSGWSSDGGEVATVTLDFLASEGGGSPLPAVALCLGTRMPSEPAVCQPESGSVRRDLPGAPEGTVAVLVGSPEDLAAWDDVEWVTDPAEVRW